MNALHNAFEALHQISWSRLGAFVACLGGLTLPAGCATHGHTNPLTHGPLSSSLADATIGVAVSSEPVTGAPKAPRTPQAAEDLSTVGKVVYGSVFGSLYGCAMAGLGCPGAFVVAPVAAVLDARDTGPCPKTKLSKLHPDLAREFGAILEREIPLTELRDRFVADLQQFPRVRATPTRTGHEKAKAPRIHELLAAASEQNLDYVLLAAVDVEPPSQESCDQWKVAANISGSLWGVEKRALVGRRWLHYTILIDVVYLKPLLGRPGVLRGRLVDVFENAPVQLLTATETHVLITRGTRIDLGEQPQTPSCASYGCRP